MSEAQPNNGAAVAAVRPHSAPTTRNVGALSLVALGVVYGDIGTSPLYAMRQSFLDENGIAITAPNVLAVLSLIFWSLLVTISVKYLGFILRADNRGEGGILALTSLVTPLGDPTQGRRWLILLGLFATGTLYGDGMITPAISVLSAVEGLGVATPLFEPYIIPITLAILLALFMVQKAGTAGLGKVFGPITLLWFATLAVLGVANIVREPGVLGAVSPHHAVRFFLENGWSSFLVLGSVVLVVTGGEALYADMGHFGRRPIRLAWFGVVLPALLLNYFGQGALILSNPAAVENPFFRMAPSWALYPLVMVATAATVIASQALISGCFSLTTHAVHLGYCPRVEIHNTSAEERGQIYVPAVNWILMIACIGLVVGFGSSDRLGAAYGVAVTTTMVVTSILFFAVVRERWKWSLLAALLVVGSLLVIDLAFWAACLIKIAHGGWFPLLVGLVVFTLLTTWKKGRQILTERTRARALPQDAFFQGIMTDPPTRVRGVAVYMSNDPLATPPALLHNLKHNKVLHEQVVFLSVRTAEVPYVQKEERTTVETRAPGFYQVVLTYGFMDDVHVPRELAAIQREGLQFKLMETTYFLGRETLIPSRRKKGMAIWREQIFSLMSRNARNAASFFRLPPNRVVELGTQIEI